MSTPVVFFVAAAGEALTGAFPADLEGKPTVKAKNIAPDMIGDLDFLLTGERTREPVCVRDDVAVFRLAEELVGALAQLDDMRIGETADAWEIYDIDGTVLLLIELRVLARDALAREENVFLYF